MRHLKRTAKLGRTSEHRNAMLANLVCSLIEHKRVTTTLAKAKAARSVAEKMVTLGKKAPFTTAGWPSPACIRKTPQKSCSRTLRPRSKIAKAATPASSSWNSVRATPPSAPSLNGWTPWFRPLRRKRLLLPKPRRKRKSNFV